MIWDFARKISVNKKSNSTKEDSLTQVETIQSLVICYLNNISISNGPSIS
jgi:hypothetical protein